MLTIAHGQERGQGTGTIEGMITVAGGDDVTEEILRGRLMSRYGGHSLHMVEQVQPYRLSEKTVVYIDDIEEPGSDQEELPRPKLNQHQMMFRPLVLPVVAGATVDFPNNDDLYHNVFSYSRAREFDLGRYPTGQKKSITFEKPGIVKVYCDIHSYMYSTIIVLRSHHFAVPSDDGFYRIPDVPEGTHSLVFWYGRKIVDTRAITVKAGSVTTVDFSR